MKKLLGPHLAGSWISNLETLRQWQPPIALVLQPDVGKVEQLRAACPDAVIIGRIYHDDSHYASNIAARPKEFAREIHQEIIGNPVTSLLDYVQSNNETNQSWDEIGKLNEFTLEWMHLADQSQAYKCAILAFSVGNPDLPYKPGDPAGFDGRMLYWQQVLPSLNYAQRKDHLLLLHAYGYPNMFAPDANWFVYRYERQVQANLRMLGITNLKYAYGEIGIDRLITGNKGGYKVVTNDQDYVNQNLQWERDQQGQDLLLGGAIFTLGDSGGWGTYDIASTNVASMIAAHYVEHAGDYNMPDAPAGNQTAFIPNVSTGTSPAPALPPRDIDPRAEDRGTHILDGRHLPPGQQYWRVKRLYTPNEEESDRLGPDRHILANVLVDGKRQVGVPLRVTWGQGGPNERATIHTKQNDNFAFSADHALTPGEFTIMVDDGKPSEIVTGIKMGMQTPDGWNPGAHTSALVDFELTTVPATTPAPTPQPVPATRQYVIVLDGAYIRAEPIDGQIVSAVPYGEWVDVKHYHTSRGQVWAYVQWWETVGYIRADLLGDKRPQTTPTPAPAPEQPGPVASPIVQTRVLDPLVLEAILQVESGGRTHGTDGRPIIRFEAHVFRGRVGNTERFDKFFRFNQTQPWTGQEWRPSIDSPWQPIHTGRQMNEYDAFAAAQMLNVEAAHQSISIGAAQIMGFNHARIGYPSAESMFDAFSRSANAQLIGMVNFILSDPKLVGAVNARDWNGIANGYNGSGNVAEAAAKYRAAYERLRP